MRLARDTNFAAIGADPVSAREPRLGHTPDPIALLAGMHGACVVHVFDNSNDCNSLAEAKLGKVIIWAPCLPGLAPGQVRVNGLVPDGVRTVVLHLTNGASKNTAVYDNAYEVVSPNRNARPLAISFTARGMTYRVPTPIDVRFLPPTCVSS